MSETCLSRQVRRVNRNLLLVNGALLALLLLFAGLMALGTSLAQRSWSQMEASTRERGTGSPVLAPHEAFDLSNPTRLGAGEVSEARLAQLEGQAVTLSDAGAMDSMIPVWFWPQRATGSRKPGHPPSYRISVAGGRPLLILPPIFQPGVQAGPALTGVIRPLAVVDAEPVKGMLLARGIQGEMWPYVLDGLDVGEMKGLKTEPTVSPIGWRSTGPGSSPLFLLMFGSLLALSSWNVTKAIRRKRNPLSHPIYARLSRYAPSGTPPRDIERAIDADYRRGAQAVGRAEFTSSWLLINGFWGLDAVPLNAIVWVHQHMMRYRHIPIPVLYNVAILDRWGQSHAIYTSGLQVPNMVGAITRGRPWMEVGPNSPLRQQFGHDVKGFIAAVEARRKHFSSTT